MNNIYKAVLLRQQVPPDKERITYNSLEECDDMWTFLFYKIAKNLNIPKVEIWLWGSDKYREVKYLPDLTEKWFINFPTKRDDSICFLFSRGGFREYIPVFKNNPQVLSLYYGAIFKKRLNPSAVGDTTKYDLILADSKKQYEQLKESGYNVHKFLKPACENIFKPIKKEKKFDVVFIANAAQKAFKGHEWFFKKMAGSNLTILQIGNLDRDLLDLAATLKLKIHFTGYIRRKYIPEMACQAKVGVCCSTGDSCPRIIPELLAMNIPVIVRKNDGLSIWDDYRTESACFFAEEYGFRTVLESYVANYDNFKSPRMVYNENFSIDISARDIANRIKELHSQKLPL